MLRSFALCLALFCVSSVFAETILVQNAEELNAVNGSAKPGDTIVLQNGIWNNAVIKLNCSGTPEKPIVFKAQTPGKVVISGVSQLRLGGNYIIVEGLLFTNGYSPSNSVIDFRISNHELANHCRITNCVINDFNKPNRIKEDNWVSFSGQHNRIDHCSFLNKKNFGVLVAVLLDDDRSRVNFHSIDHNYFGIRLPLASNGGEIIRVGLSQHALFNSNTQIKNNFFEHCDGEAEVISIKSCANVVSDNVFKECQGSVVLRHGNDNTVINNLFLGNGKEGTGGVRIINRGQWVINNLFYKCRGESFRAPLVIMNGIPNSPANRYVQVTGAVVLNNSFVDCAPMSFGEGSDKERTLPASNVLFAKNIFYNDLDSLIYHAWDDISGIRFVENKISGQFTQSLTDGFVKTSFATQKVNVILLPVAEKSSDWIGLDSLVNLDKERLPKITKAAGFNGADLIKKLQANAASNCGAKWFHPQQSAVKSTNYYCKTAADIYDQLSKKAGGCILHLTGTDYFFDKPVVINGNVRIRSSGNKIRLSSKTNLPALFIIKGKAQLSLDDLKLSTDQLIAQALIATDTLGSPEHYTLQMENVSIENLNSCSTIFYAHKSTLADSMVIQDCSFSGVHNGFLLADEKDNRGYYNVEKIKFISNQFTNANGILLNLYRGGSDESTLGPDLIFSNNTVVNCNAGDGELLIQLTGVQKTKILNNTFKNCNSYAALIMYKDTVRAKHILTGNKFIQSGSVQKNRFVEDSGNIVQ